MNRYGVQQRLTYIGGGVRVQQAMWPSLSSNWWEVSGETCVAAYQPKGAASLAASYSNLANPGTYDAAPGTAPTWDSTNGWIFAAASSQYLTTGVVPADGTYTVIARYAGVTINVTTQAIIGSRHGTADRAVVCYVSTGGSGSNQLSFRYAASIQQPAATASTSGVIALAGGRGYKDGSAVGSLMTGWTGTSTEGLYIGAINTASAAGSYLTGNVQAVAIYSTTLDTTQISNLTTAMNAL